MSGARRRWGLAAVIALACAGAALVPADAAAIPFRSGEYRVVGKDWDTYLLLFRTSRDLRWVTSSVTAQYQNQNCRLAGRRLSYWVVFPMPKRMSLSRDGRFAKLDAWPHITGRFSADGSRISLRLWSPAVTLRRAAGTLRCPATDHRFEARVYLPAGDYAGTTAQGHRISFTLGGSGRTLVSNLSFGLNLACEPSGAVTQTYSGLSGKVDTAGFPVLKLSTGGAYAGGTRTGFIQAEWSGVTVTGFVAGEWTPPEPGDEDETSPFFCSTPDDGFQFTARLVRRAPGT